MITGTGTRAISPWPIKVRDVGRPKCISPAECTSANPRRAGHESERRDEGRNLDVGDGAADQAADESAKSKHEQHSQKRVQSALDQAECDDCDECDCRTDGKVNARAGYHECHSHRNYDNERSLGQDVGQVGDRAETRIYQYEKDSQDYDDGGEPYALKQPAPVGVPD